MIFAPERSPLRGGFEMTQNFRFNIPEDYEIDPSRKAEVGGTVYSGPYGSMEIGFSNLQGQPTEQAIESYFEGLGGGFETITGIRPVTFSGLNGVCCRYLVGNDDYYTKVNLQIDGASVQVPADTLMTDRPGAMMPADTLHIGEPGAQIPADTLVILLRAGSLGELQLLESELDLAHMIEIDYE